MLLVVMYNMPTSNKIYLLLYVLRTSMTSPQLTYLEMSFQIIQMFHQPLSNLKHSKTGLQKYWETNCSRSGGNQLWILKNARELLECLKFPNFNYIRSINSSFFFLTLYTNIPCVKLNSRFMCIACAELLHFQNW